MQIEKIGFIGLGNVGAKLAGTLMRHDLLHCVRDLDSEAMTQFTDAGIEASTSPREMAENCDMVITCLPSPQICAAVFEGPGGVLEGLAPGKIWAEMSTTDANEVKRLAEKVLAKGAEAIECPVSGGCHRAATGNISIFAGAERSTFEAALPVLTRLGRRILHTGPVGSASILKVMTNYLATANLVTLSEALTTMKAAGIDLATTYEAIRISSGTSFVHETESQVILNGSREINFTMDLVAKDIGLFQSIAEKTDVPLRISPLLVAIFDEAIEAYGPRERSPNIIRTLEDATGLEIRASGFPTAMLDDEPEERGHEVRRKS
jgi:3-hydroxyisobutyrate dehydrogenase